MFKTLEEFLNEDDFSYGAKGKIEKSPKKDEKIVDYEKISKEDKEVFSKICTTLTKSANTLKELDDFLSEYNKINHKPISEIINMIEAFQLAIQKELSKFS